MKLGIKTIQNLYGELERQRAARKDLIADTRSITVNSVNGLSMLTVATDSDKLSYRISEIAHRQIADRLGIPYKYYERMRQENPALLDSNINSWLNTTPEKRMLRTLDGKLRAFLSDRYRRLDNLELVDHVLPVIAAMKGCEIASISTPETLTLIGTFIPGLISAYSSSIGVVMPTFLPLIPGLVEQVGGDLMSVFSGVCLGSFIVDASPLSTLGALTVGAATAEMDKRKLFNQLMAWGLSMTVIGAVTAWILF